jgi:hypothetical protein
MVEVISVVAAGSVEQNPMFEFQQPFGLCRPNILDTPCSVEYRYPLYPYIDLFGEH